MEDARAALAVYKFKSEILDRHGLNLEESDFGLVTGLASKYQEKITLIGQTEEVCGFKEFGLKTEELAVNNVESVIEKILAAIKENDSVVIGKIDLLQPHLFDGGSK